MNETCFLYTFSQSFMPPIHFRRNTFLNLIQFLGCSATKLVDSWTNLKRRAHSDLKCQVKAETGLGRPPNNSALGTQPELRARSDGLGKLIYRHSIINSFQNWTSYKQKSEKKFNHFRLKCESRLKRSLMNLCVHLDLWKC